MAIQVFTPAAIHNAVCTAPVAWEIHPPLTAPSRMAKKANTLRFRFALPVRAPKRCGSAAVSHSRLVTTTVGISLMSKTRLPISCPAAWKLSKAMGARDFQSMSGEEEIVGMVWLIAPDWKRTVAVMMKRAWIRNEIASVPRRRG